MYIVVCRHHIYIHVQSGYLSIALEPLDSQTQPTTNRKLRYSLLIRQTDSGHMPLRGDGRGSKKENTTIKTSMIHRKKKKKMIRNKERALGSGEDPSPNICNYSVLKDISYIHATYTIM